MRSERPLGTWCGYKQAGETHGGTKDETGACGRNRKGEMERGTTSVRGTTELPRNASWSEGRYDGTAAVVESTQHERRVECVSAGVFAAC